jgi:uridine kinase
MKKFIKQCYVIFNCNEHLEDELSWTITKKTFTLFDGEYYWDDEHLIGYHHSHVFNMFDDAKNYILKFIKDNYEDKYNSDWLFENYLKTYINMKENN